MGKLQSKMGLNIALAVILAFTSLLEVEGHTKGTQPYAYFDAYKNSGGTTCNAQRPVTGWTVTSDRSWSAAGAKTDNAAFGTGTGIYTFLKKVFIIAVLHSGASRGVCVTGLSSGMGGTGMSSMEHSGPEPPPLIITDGRATLTAGQADVMLG